MQVVKVLPIYELGQDEEQSSGVWVDPYGKFSPWLADDDVGTSLPNLPTAEPGGLVVVERIDCPPCGGRGFVSKVDRHLSRNSNSAATIPCPTCTTPPKVTT